LLAVSALLLILVGLPMSVLAYQKVYLPASYGEVKVIDLVARVPEAGGWSPEVITVNKGDLVRLRISSPSVVHGFAIGKMGIDVGQIIPGEVTTVEFVAEDVGRFTYYCNVWCSPSHYRMRGTLEVIDASAHGALLTSAEEPSSTFEGLDIDAPHEAKFYPPAPPSAVAGRAIAGQVALPDLGDLRRQSPEAVFEAIRREDSADLLPEEEIWNLVAYLWSRTTTPERLEAGAALYDKNCVGCHGEAGRGDGPGSRHLEHAPTDFTAARTMAGGNGAIYYAKTRRGGMGTGMPYWGTIFSEEETWSIVDYLWTFLFEAYR
jgi:cytochrome c oxidase subunit 2